MLGRLSLLAGGTVRPCAATAAAAAAPSSRACLLSRGVRACHTLLLPRLLPATALVSGAPARTAAGPRASTARRPLSSLCVPSPHARTRSLHAPLGCASPTDAAQRRCFAKKKHRIGSSSSLDDCIREIEQSFGKGTIVKLGAHDAGAALEPHEVISTGSIGLDVALGTGGLPRGRVTEVFGPEASGKTTLALHAIAQAQRLGGQCAFIDAEHALDPLYAQRLGINTHELLVSQPDCGEQALEIADALIRSNRMDVIVIDSVAALVPKAELDGDMGDAHIGLQARLMSQAMRKLTASLSRSNCVLMFINQIRMKVGVMFGSPEVTSGGNALKFYSTLRLDVRRIAQLKKGDEVVGNRVRVSVKKNKLAAPFRSAEFDIEFGRGISRFGELLDLGFASGVLEKSGSWYSYGEEQIGQGREKVKMVLEERPELAEEIEAKVRAMLLPLVERAESEGSEAEVESEDDDEMRMEAVEDVGTADDAAGDGSGDVGNNDGQDSVEQRNAPRRGRPPKS